MKCQSQIMYITSQIMNITPNAILPAELFKCEPLVETNKTVSIYDDCIGVTSVPYPLKQTGKYRISFYIN